MLEESFVAVPLLLFLLRVQVQWIVALLRLLREQRKIQTLYRRRAFNRQLFADSLLVFEAFDLVTAGAAELLDQLPARLLQIWIVHERRALVRRRRRKREKIRGDVARFRFT